MDPKTGMILWSGAGIGVFLIWSGATNRLNLGETLAAYLRGDKPPAPAGKSDSNGSENNGDPIIVGGSFGEGNKTESVAPSVGGPLGNALNSLRTNVQADVTGTYYVYDNNGNMLERIPDIYQSRPYAYIPKRG